MEIKEVTSELLYTPDGKIHPEGLLSEVIFGPVKNYSCTCGKYNIKNIHNDLTCPVCNVKCTHSDVRYTTFGKIVLPFPVIRLKEIKKFRKYFSNFLNSNQIDLLQSLNLYLYYNSKKDKLEIFNEKKDIILPVTGIYSLYLNLSFLKIKFPNSVVINELINSFYLDLLVIPPECRIVLSIDEDKKRIFKHILNRIYIEILNIKKYFLKDNSNYLEKVTSNFNNLLTNKLNSDDLNQIKYYDIIANKFQICSDKLYSEVSKVLSGKTGLIRSDFLGKNIDFCGRAVIINDPSLAAYQIKIPKKMFFKLWILEYYRYLRCFKYKNVWDLKSINNINKLMSPCEKSEFSINFDDYEYFDEFVEYYFNNTMIKDRLVYINRQPTLWRYGLIGVEVVGINNHDSISVSPLIVHGPNMDFDGDTAAIYKVHDTDSKKELYDNAFVANLVKYDHNDTMVHTIANEAKYAFNILNSSEIKKDTTIKPSKFYDPNVSIYSRVDDNISYGKYLLSNWYGLSNDELYKISYDNFDYHKKLKNLNLYLNWFLSCNTEEIFSLPFNEKLNKNELLNKLPNNPYVGYNIYVALTEKIYDSIPSNYTLYKLSKIKFRKVQFIRSLISIGYIADNNNMVDYKPVTTNILSGLTEDEFFRTSFGTRKGIVDKDKNVPNAGYMQRTMIINLSNLELIEDDCESDRYFEIEIKNENHCFSLNNRYYLDPKTNELKLFDGFDLTNIGKTFNFRSPITCKTKNFKLCKKCFGNYNISSPFVGVLAGQYIEERITQLIISSFHTSGSAVLDTDPELIELIKNNLIDIINYDDKFDLVFNKDIDDSIFYKNIYKFIGSKDKRIFTFLNYKDKVENNDVNKINKLVNDLLKSQKYPKIDSIYDTYLKMILSLLSINKIYSVYVELLFANTFFNKDNELIRYAENDFKPYYKKNIKQLHINQSKILSLIYEPNFNTIIDYYNNCNSINGTTNIFERIWLGDI